MRLSIYAFLAYLFSAFVMSTPSLADRVTLEVPDSVRDGDSVPVRVSLDKPLAGNEVLSIIANSEIVVQVLADTDVELTRFSTSVILPCTECTVSATIAVDGYLIESLAVDKKLLVAMPGKIRDNYRSSLNHNAGVKLFGQRLHVRVKNGFRVAKIETERGFIKVRANPYLTRPSFTLKSKNGKLFDSVSRDSVECR